MTDASPSLEIHPDLARRLLTDFLRTEIERAGFSRAVVGVSGGVDSALACFLAAEALGPKNVLAVRLPFAESSADSLEDAAEVIRRTGVASHTFDITPMAAPLLETIPAKDRVRRGNVLARLRMIVLYDQSAAFGGLVVGTGNKTEALLGYTTLYGDSACALNPIGDLYKTQVRQLAAAMGVPERILRKAPSADLWPGQTDEGELGMTYDEVDRLLVRLIDDRQTPQACIEAGFAPSLVRRTVERIRKNQYKRLPPIIAKVSSRTPGTDFLYPRDWDT
ncbi:MAG TPA: NAD+ synthase [Anaerolineales bacterium]|nr:NAD+ synthase [Anaerolineales bacterium]